MNEPKKILLLDDDETILSLLEIALQSAGYNPISCVSAVSLLESAEKENPDLILLDIVMPDIDGFTLNRKLKENPVTKNIPVIIVSGKGKMKELFNITSGAHIAGFLEKPLTPAMLIEKVKELVG